MCKWHQDPNDDDKWASGCQHKYVNKEGPFDEHGDDWTVCPYCGWELEIIERPDHD